MRYPCQLPCINSQFNNIVISLPSLARKYFLGGNYMWLIARIKPGQSSGPLSEDEQLEEDTLKYVADSMERQPKKEYIGTFEEGVFDRWSHTEPNQEPNPDSIVFIGHGANYGMGWASYASQNFEQNASNFVSDLIKWSSAANKPDFLQSIKTIYVLGCEIGLQPLFGERSLFLQAVANALFQNEATKHIKLRSFFEKNQGTNFEKNQGTKDFYTHMAFQVDPRSINDTSRFAPVAAPVSHGDYDTMITVCTDEQWRARMSVRRDLKACEQDFYLLDVFSAKLSEFLQPQEDEGDALGELQVQDEDMLYRVNAILWKYEGKGLPTDEFGVLKLPKDPQELMKIYKSCQELSNKLREKRTAIVARGSKIDEELEQQGQIKKMGPLLKIREQLSQPQYLVNPKPPSSQTPFAAAPVHSHAAPVNSSGQLLAPAPASAQVLPSATSQKLFTDHSRGLAARETAPTPVSHHTSIPSAHRKTPPQEQESKEELEAKRRKKPFATQMSAILIPSQPVTHAPQPTSRATPPNKRDKHEKTGEPSAFEAPPPAKIQKIKKTEKSPTTLSANLDQSAGQPQKSDSSLDSEPDQQHSSSSSGHSGGT